MSITSTFHVGNGFEEGVIDDDDDDEEVEELEGELSDSKEDRAVICRSRKLVIFESRWSVRRRVTLVTLFRLASTCSLAICLKHLIHLYHVYSQSINQQVNLQ